MAITVTGSTHANFGANGGTTTAADVASGSPDWIVLHVSYYSGFGATGAGTWTDSVGGNTYTPLTNHANGVCGSRLFLCLAPSVSSTMTFTYSEAASFSSGQILWGAGMLQTSPTDKQNGNTTAANPMSTGAVDPSPVTGEIYIAGLGSESLSGTISINSGFTGLIADPFVGGTSEAGALAYKLSAGSENPAFSFTAFSSIAASIATFKAAAAGGSASRIFWPARLDGIGSGGPFSGHRVG